jgi:hypothetical protein
MYHPPQTNEAACEWIELRNQMAVDMDLSGWALAGGVAYAFPEGTIIPGRGYLVVARSPADLIAAAGVTNVCGPFAGQFSNSGETLELRNNNDRLMDELDYGTEGAWPVAPDGTGPSLAKIDEDGPTADPANWRASGQMGGSPGTTNAPPDSLIAAPTAVRLDGVWHYLADGTTPGTDWNTRFYNDNGWGTGTGLFHSAGITWYPIVTQAVGTLFNSGVDDYGQVLAAGVADPHYVLTASANSTPPPPNISATVMANHSAWLANNATSRWIGAVASGNTGVAGGRYLFQTSFDLTGMDMNSATVSLRVAADNRVTDVLLNGTSKGIAYVGFSAFSSTFTLSNGFSSAVNTLAFCATNEGAGPSGFRVETSGTAARWLPTNSVLPISTSVDYFRTCFVVTGDVSTATLSLRTVLDDGAVYYLNGTEVLRLNLAEGAITSTTAASTNVIRAALSDPYSLSAASLVAGTNVLAVEVHQAASGSGDIAFGAELALSITNRPTPHVPTLAFNELPSVTNQVFWAEILNTGSQSVSLSNYVFKRFGDPDRDYVIPPQSIAPGGRIVLNRADLGFGADPGDRLALYTPGYAAVVDAVVAKRYPQARWPEGTGPWLHPDVTTPGATNRIALCNEIVINEIMYHPRDPQGPATNSPEQWIELYNRGAAAVDLTGWTLEIDGQAAFSFPTGQTLAVGGYLVVARDATYLRGLYPSIGIVGDLTRRLPGGGGNLALFDATGNPANALTYGDGPPWPSYADGLGASLELRDPRADNSRPEAWAASDDRAKAAWQTITYRGTATVETASCPTLWKEFVLGLIGEGEVLLDDISVVQQPASVARQLIQNGSFETGTNAWRIIGNHRHSEVVVDPDNAANSALRLVSDGYTEHMHNHAETTLANGVAVTNGLEYEISFRAKWATGCNRLLTRLYFNRLPRLTELAVPALVGTPGARNSTYAANLGPTFRDLSHAPVVPIAGQAVSISVIASDPDGVATGVLHYAVNSGTWQTLPMILGAASGGGVMLGATVPGQAAGSIVQFYAEATDGLGTTAMCPADGTNSRALFEVSNGTAVMTQLHTVRVILTTEDTAYIHNTVNVMSNERIGCTLITDERNVAYDAGMHLQGSERGRPSSSRVGFTVRLPSDRLYRGVLGGITVDRSGGYSNLGGDPDEILLKHAINKAGGLPGMYDDLCQVFAPRTSDDGIGLLLLAKYGGEFLDTQYKNGADGELFKLEYVYYPLTNSVAGDVQSPKLPNPDDVKGTDIKDLGNNPEAYRWTFLKENHTERNNYAPMVALAKAFSLTGTALDAQTRQLMDVDEWMRGVAFTSLIGNGDGYTFGTHNAIFYFRPEDGKGLFFPWDMDYAFCQATNAAFPGTGASTTARLITTIPSNLHAYYGHLYDLASITGDSAYMGRWATHYSGLLGQNWSGIVTYLKNRADYVRSQLPLSIPFAVTNNLGNGFGVTNSPVTLAGTGSVTVKSIAINGVEYAVSWTSATNWTVAVPLPDVTNQLTLQACDLRGNVLANASDSITVTNFGLLAPQPVVINEWMADNGGPGGYPDAADQKHQDWFELFNPNYTSVNLSGYTLTDDLAKPAKWSIPSNTVIAARGFLLVWADDESAQNGSGTNGDLHAAFKLSNDGEAIGLFSPAGVRQHALAFGQQLKNVSQGLYPDGNTNAVYDMTNWTPRAANRLGAPTAPNAVALSVEPAASVTFSLSATAGHAYAVEYKNDLRDSLWLTLGTNRALGDTCVFTDDSAAGVTQRFYRAILIP